MDSVKAQIMIKDKKKFKRPRSTETSTKSRNTI